MARCGRWKGDKGFKGRGCHFAGQAKEGSESIDERGVEGRSVGGGWRGVVLMESVREADAYESSGYDSVTIRRGVRVRRHDD